MLSINRQYTSWFMQRYKELNSGYTEGCLRFPSKCQDIVYILQADNGLFKVGITNNIKNRIQNIKAQSPIGINLISLLYTQNARDIEYDIHIEYAHKRKHGEWFELNKVDIENISSKYGFENEQN